MKGLAAAEMRKMDTKARGEKLKELRLELIRSNVRGRQTKVRTKEIKKAIARLLTVINAERKTSSKKTA